MSKKKIFYGAATALITPFKKGEVDYNAFCELIDRQLSGGIEALVIGGTTAEAATLSDRERYKLFETARERVGGRAKLIFGTGTNDTSLAVKHTKKAERIGCDGALVVTPYYNKGTYRGLIQHYERIANSVDLPIIVYNVPSRTGVNLEISALEQLSKTENIVGIKEASDSAERLISLGEFGDELYLYAGNDSSVYTVLSLGGQGVISVVSNILPEAICEICKSYERGEQKEALKLQLKLLPFIRTLFLETNPAPIKYAMSRKWEGLDLPGVSGELRLPLSEVTDATARSVERELSAFLNSRSK